MGPELLRVSWLLLKPLPGGNWGVLKWGRTVPLKTPSPSPPILRWCRWRRSCLVLDSLLLLNLTNHSGTRKPNPKLPVYKSYHPNGRLFIIKKFLVPAPLFLYVLSAYFKIQIKSHHPPRILLDFIKNCITVICLVLTLYYLSLLVIPANILCHVFQARL